MIKKQLIQWIVSFSFCLCFLPGFSQKTYSKGDVVQDVELKKLLNHTSQSSSLNKLRNKLTVIDFFGTWCVPCLKALPHLTKIQQQYKDDVSIVLVSNETESQLTNFIKKRQNFLFPVIVDEGNQLNNLFNPPALPYTVILNKEGRIVDITEAEKINDENIQKWMNETQPIVNNSKPTTQTTASTNMQSNNKSSNSTVQLSQDFIYAAKTGNAAEAFLMQLRNLNYNDVLALNTDDLKKAFWINVYNGYNQLLLRKNPELYKDRKSFFTKKQLEVAGMLLSFDDIEHGFLRRSKIKWSYGHFSKLFPSKREKDLRVNKVDYRIHFALNCGAKSCPPIAFYNDRTLDAQLELATKAYLSGEAEYDAAKNEIQLPKLMSWFRADFDGKKGMLRILKKHSIVPQDAKPKIEFKNYDWNLYLDNFKTEPI